MPRKQRGKYRRGDHGFRIDPTKLSAEEIALISRLAAARGLTTGDWWRETIRKALKELKREDRPRDAAE